MKINYSGIIAEEQCMKASSWQPDEPVAHINVVKRLVTQVNEAKEESADLRMQVDVMSTRVDARTLALEAENKVLRELSARLISKLEHSHFLRHCVGIRRM
jgi:hypothetical protein